MKRLKEQIRILLNILGTCHCPTPRHIPTFLFTYETVQINRARRGFVAIFDAVLSDSAQSTETIDRPLYRDIRRRAL